MVPGLVNSSAPVRILAPEAGVAATRSTGCGLDAVIVGEYKRARRGNQFREIMAARLWPAGHTAAVTGSGLPRVLLETVITACRHEPTDIRDRSIDLFERLRV